MQYLKTSKKCFIFGALPVSKAPLLPSGNDVIIAADKGAIWANKLRLKPDLIIGDFDSLGHTPNGENIWKLPVKKDLTDIAAAAELVINAQNSSHIAAPEGVTLPDFSGVSEIVVYGGIGELLDHTLANLQLACQTAKSGINPIFFGDDITVTAVHNSRVTLPSSKGRVSVFCMSEKAEGVTIKGLEYELENATLSPDNPIGVSNRFTGCEAEISVKNGTLIVTMQSDIIPIF